MDLRKLQRVVVDALEDVKGQDIRVFNTQDLTGLFDRVVVVSGTSNRQTRALAASVRDKVREAGGHVISVEGEDGGEWVLVDLGDVVVHVMQPAIRSYYNLEELWGAKPVRVRLGGRRVTRADEPIETPAAAAATPARRRTASPRAPRTARAPSA
jgi:ribosome-associated protein